MKIQFFATALLLSAGTAALAQEGTQQPVAGSQAEAAPQEKTICKVEKVTGSLTNRRRLCMTQSEWKRIAELTGSAMDRLGRDANKNATAYANPLGYK